MFRICSFCYGGAVGRKAAASAAVAGTGMGKRRPRKQYTKAQSTRSAGATGTSSSSRVNTSKIASVNDDEGNKVIYASARPAYMSEKREKEVLKMAERMQGRDLSGDVPVASFAYEIIQKHPSVRMMGLRERMDFLCTRWAKLPEKKRLEYLNDPLKGLL